MEKERLQSVFELFPLSTSGFKDLYTYLISMKISIPFEIDANLKAEGAYIFTNKSNKIVFNSIDAINFSTLVEELFHAVQHQKFYNNRMDSKYKNYEFEAKVFKDACFALCLSDPNCQLGSNDYSATMYSGCKQEFREKYRKWMEDIVEAGYISSYLLGDFKELCKEWQGDDGEYDSSFHPQVLHYFMTKKPPKPKPPVQPY